MIVNLGGLKLLPIGPKHHSDCVGILDRFRRVRLTYVDASSLVLIQQHRIRQVWSTDHHLGLTGAEVLPRA